MSLFYLFTVMFGFAFWSILDVVLSRNVGADSVRCIMCCIDSGIFWTGIFYARGVYNGRLCGRSFSLTSSEVVAVRRVGVLV